MSYKIASNLYTRYVKGTENGAIVQDVQIFLCNLTQAVVKGIGCDCVRAYIGTRALKHVYDKRPAEEFDFLLEHVHQITKYPDRVYRNKGGKRGNFIFVKKLKNEKYICSVQEVLKEGENRRCEIATFFRVRKENYLASYDLLWEWKGDTPSS